MAQRRKDSSEQQVEALEPPAMQIREHGPIEFRPRPGLHLCDAGIVAKSNWRGMVNGRRVHVYRGAQQNQMPDALVDRCRKSGIEFGEVTMRELGLTSRPQVAAAQASVESRNVAAGANLLG